jgi:hypothetical protein
MGVATVATTLTTASAHLNDSRGTFWAALYGTPPTSTAYAALIPFLQEAFRDLQNELFLNGLPVLHKTALLLNFPAGTTALTLTSTPALPSDIIVPVTLFERDAGASAEDFDEMVEKSWLPEEQQDEELTYWQWEGQQINFLGATTARDLQLNYDAGLPLPALFADTLGFTDAEFYIAPKTAAYAAESIDRYKRGETLHAQAESKLSKIIRANVKNQQSLPVRRRPYRRVRNFIIGR